MRKFLFLIISLCLLFTGCDNFLSKRKDNPDSDSGIIRLKFAQNGNKNVRTISPSNDNPFSNVDAWKIEFISDDYTVTQENVSLNDGAYDVQLPVGTYTINVEGVITDEQTQIIWIGSASNIILTAGETVPIEIQVSLKKEGFGSFIYTVDINLPKPEYVGDFVVELKNLNNGNIISTSQGNPSEEFGNVSSDGNGLWFVAMENIPAGFYKLDIKYMNMSDGKYYSLLLADPLVEIINGVISRATSQAIQLGISRVYYATTEESDYNGLTEAYPANLESLIHILAESDDWEDVKIYCDDTPDAAAINAADVAKIQKEIKVYCNKVLRFTIKDKKIDTGFVEVAGIAINGTETWTPASDVFVSGRQFAIPDLLVCDHEVTRGEYKAVMGTDPSGAAAYDKNGNLLTGDAVLDNPVNTVSWYDAITYCNKLSIKEGLTPCYSVEGVTDWATFDYSLVPAEDNAQWNAVICNIEADGYRLPTEAEWEYLARGGENYTYAGSDTADVVAWYNQITGGTGTRTVKTKLPNGYGLYDMCGNVFEWCWDRDAKYILPGSNRVLRGGSWDVNAYTCTDRVEDWPNMRREYEYQEYGFRVVRTINTRQKEDMIEVQGITITGTEIWDPASSVFVADRKLTIPDLIACDHEVTRGEFSTVMGQPVQEFMDELTAYLTNVYDKDGNTVTGDAQLNLPMSGINWYHAMAYCNKLSLREGLTPCYSVEEIDDWGYLKFTDIPAPTNYANATEEEQNLIALWNSATCNFSANGYRLPTEAEWEWLARGGNDHTEYAGSNNIDEVGWYEPDDEEEEDYGAHLVKLLKPNGYGLYDMTGNVYEMCWDKDTYPITSTTPATGGESGFYRVVRGGSYFKSDYECSMIPSGNYSSDWNEEKDYVMCYDYGFRVVRTRK